MGLLFRLTWSLMLVVIGANLQQAASSKATKESVELENPARHPKVCTPGGRYRPLIHHSPLENFMGEPHGLIVGTSFNGAYHLHYQYNTNGTTLGDPDKIHWGHAVSYDMVNWKEQQPALYPDDLGPTLSGSAVRDAHNTSGFQLPGDSLMVFVYTQKAGPNEQPTLGLAFTNDNGVTYEKYAKNPLPALPGGLSNFRDPKLIRFNDYKWIMLLSAGDRIVLYSSWNLKQWEKLSEFGADVGSHAGPWEQPDLVVFEYEGWEKWVLIVSMKTGGPNGGSGTQYFYGDFDGVVFTLDEAASDTLTKSRWIDDGPDNYGTTSYASLTSPWPIIKVQGMASNWDYAEITPSDTYRGAVTLPRELELLKRNGLPTLIRSWPLEIEDLYLKGQYREFQLPSSIIAGGSLLLSDLYPFQTETFELVISFNTKLMGLNSTLETCFFNSYEEELCLVYEKRTNRVILDRSRSGAVDFSDKFSLRPYSQRAVEDDVVMYDIIMDGSIIEVLMDHGASSMTAQFFPIDTFREIRVDHVAPEGEKGSATFFGGSITGMQSIYC